MVNRLQHKVIITPQDIKPSWDGYKVIGVFNPSAVRFGDGIYLMIRVAEQPVEQKEGYSPSPRALLNEGKFDIECDWFPVNPHHDGDTRKFEAQMRHMRLCFISHLRLVKMDKTGFEVLEIDEHPTFFPQLPYEEFGVEDPRMTCIEGKFYFTYVVVSSSMGVATALASTTDFKNYRRHGIVFCKENKDVVLFPEKVKNKYVAYHRPVGGHRFQAPSMEAAFSPDLIHWGEHRPLIEPRIDCWDADRIGAGPPPIKTEKGWLEIYHGVKKKSSDEPVGVYRAGAALFDLENPAKLLARSSEPILSPEESHESQGFVNNVIFPTGVVTADDGKNLLLFSGGADTVVTATKVSLEEVMNSMCYKQP